jgi:hypothetical protein
MPDILEYAATSKPGWHRFVKPVAGALSIAAVAILWSVVIWAWVSTMGYDYSRNSFPMGEFAMQATLLASAVTVFVGLAWVVFWWLSRRGARAKERASS